MHKLSRQPTEPNALYYAREKCKDWGDLAVCKYRSRIAEALCQMQNNLCAYCECKLENGAGHIEHFRKRVLFPELTFCWENLFYSCMSEKHCGRKKDRNVTRKEDYLNLIDPSKENPEYFFVFTYDGKIASRTSLSTRERKRAEVTIEVFNLNDPALVQARKNTIKQFEWLMGYKNCVDATLSELPHGQPYITAIYHFFDKRVVTC